MQISAKAAAENLNTYQSFKDQLMPNLKKANAAILYPQTLTIQEPTSNLGVAKRSKRSKTSFDTHNISKNSSALGNSQISTNQEMSIKHSRQRRITRSGFSRKASKSGDCAPFVSIDQNVPQPEIIKKSTLSNNDLRLMDNQKVQGNDENCRNILKTKKSLITLIDLEEPNKAKRATLPNPIATPPLERNSFVQTHTRHQTKPVIQDNYVYPQQSSKQQMHLLQETNHDLGLLMSSIYDQSDNKSQTCNTINAENQLREENMQLRMEILKLKKALFMKSQNGEQMENLAEELRAKGEQLLRNHLEPRDDTNQRQQQHLTPQARVVIEDICEEGVSSYSHEDLPRVFGLQNSHLTFKQIQQSRQYPEHQEAQAVTFSRSRHNQSAQALEDLEQMLRDQGIQISESLVRNPKDFLLTDERKGLSNIFEQKRHYEQEIEILKKDLEVIEGEELMIKQRLSDQSSMILESIRLEQGAMLAAQRKSKEAKQGQINVAFDSFIEKRQVDQARCIQQIASSIDNLNLQCQSDDGVMPIVSINHHNLSQINHVWQPPSFSNSLFPSVAVSPNNTVNVPPLLIPPQNDDQSYPKMKQRGRRSRYSNRNHQNAQYNDDNNNRSLTSDISQDELQNPATSQPLYQQATLGGQTSGRLNTDMIDQLFEDPKMQSQFQCLDNDQPIISLLNVGYEFPSKRINYNDANIKNNDQIFHKKAYQEKGQENNPPIKLTHIKQTIKGVLQSYEQSLQKNSQVKHFIGDGSESKFSPKKELGIPRLSTIKEDSPEFGPFTETSDIVNHSSILRNQLQNNSRVSDQNPCEMCFKHNSSAHRSQQPSFEYQRVASATSVLKKPTKVMMPQFIKLAPQKSPLRPANSANQLAKPKRSYIKLPQKTKQMGSKPTVPASTYMSRSSSPYNTNQVSNIVNQAYMDIIKRKQRDTHETTSYIIPRANQTPMTYAGLAQMTQQKKNQMKNNKIIGQVVKKAKKPKEGGIKYLSNIVSKKQEASRNATQGNTMKVLNVSNINQSTSAISSYSFISAKANKSQTPITHLRSLSNQSRTTRPSPIPPTQLHCIEEQYDLLWSKQVTQKRMNLLKRKEETAKQKYLEKCAKIESIQKRKALEMEERKNKSKSPSNYVATTTMSEFECNTYYGGGANGGGVKLTFDKSQMNSYQGFNTVQPSSMMQSASARSPKIPGTPMVQEASCRQMYQKVGGAIMPTMSVTPSGITTNLISQQNSAGKSIIRNSRTPEVAQGTSTPVTVNKNYWDQNPEYSEGSARSGLQLRRVAAANYHVQYPENLTSSAGTTAFVTAINGVNYENQNSLRQNFHQVPFYPQIPSPNQYPSTLRNTVHHSRSNSGQKIATDKRISHKKQSSLSIPKSTGPTDNMLLSTSPHYGVSGQFIQKKANNATVAAGMGGYDQRKQQKHQIMGENDMMRQFLSQQQRNQPIEYSSGMMVRGANNTMRHEPLRFQQQTQQTSQLLQLHPVKYDGKSQLKSLPVNTQAGLSYAIPHMRLLEPISEGRDY